MRLTIACPCVLALACAGWPAPAPGQDKKPRAALTDASLIKIADEVQKEVEELRGWKFKRPVKKGVYTEKQLRAFIEKKLFEEGYGEGRLERLQAFLRMTEIIPPKCDLRKNFLDVLIEQIGGFYDPATSAFYMMNRERFGPLANRIIIAHELTHALDDQYVDLEKLLNPRDMSEDQRAAIAGVVEGSATVLMMRYTFRAQLSGKYDLNELTEMMAAEMERADVLVKAPPYFTTLVASYMCGMHFVRRGEMVLVPDPSKDKGVGADVLKALKDPPTSSEQILHPEKYWDKSKRDDPVMVSDEDVQKLVERPGTYVVHKDTAGELLCAIVTAPAERELNIMLMHLPSFWTNEAATGWGGDRFYLLAKGPDQKKAGADLRGLRGVWITLWDTHNDRDEFLEDYEYQRKIASRTAFKLGRRGAIFLFGFDADECEALKKRIEADPPRFTRAGKSWSLDAR